MTWPLQPRMKITIRLICQDRQEIFFNGIAHNQKIFDDDILNSEGRLQTIEPSALVLLKMAIRNQ